MSKNAISQKIGQTGESVDVSIVIPVYNEEESLVELQTRIVDMIQSMGRTFEVIYCDDGSSDGSLGILKDFAKKDKWVKVISFRRNFGQTAALEAGFRHASGKIVVSMDADLQNDPKDIPMLLEYMNQGYDVVKGWRKNRHDKFISRVIPSRIANWLISKITGVHLHDYGCTLTAYRKEIVDEFRLYGEMHRFIPAYAAWAGGKIKEVAVTHHARKYGQTKYNLSRTFRVVLDLLTVKFLVGYSTKPLYFFGKWGLGMLFVAFLSFLWSVAKKIMWGEPVFTDPFFYLTIFLTLAALQILSIGLLAELNMRTYFESQDKPTYVIRSTWNLGGD